MFECYTLRFAKAGLLLRTIHEHNERLDLVLELQRFLIRRISAAENRTRRLKGLIASRKQRLSSGTRPSKVEATSIKRKIAQCKQSILDQRQLMFIWRCFGDGIAFSYQSKYSLKHLYYDEEYRVKADAGFMTANGRFKSGFRREYRYLKLGIHMGIPVVMADLTNVVRHGDLCALGGADPMPVEVKSSSNQNARTIRQAENLRAIIDFYRNDSAALFRGTPNVRRVELQRPETSFPEAMNACIDEALEKGIAFTSPEPGLHYIAAFQSDCVDDFAHLLTPSTLVVQLVPAANWVPCFPFTLSLDPPHLIRFLQEKLALMVLIDLAHLKNIFAIQGIHATMVLDGVVAIRICHNPKELLEGVFWISESLFARIALEFLSLAWFAEEFSLPLKEAPETVTAEELETMNGVITAVPPEWYDVRDCYVDAQNAGHELAHVRGVISEPMSRAILFPWQPDDSSTWS